MANRDSVMHAAGRRRILQVSAYYPPHLGGQEVAVQELATQLASVGECVEVVTSDVGGKCGSAVEAGVRVTRLRSFEIGHTAIMPGLFWWLIRNVRSNTIVHLHFGQSFASEIVWITSKIIGFQYIMHMHVDLVQSGPLGKVLPLYRKLFLRRELRDAARVIVLNDSYRRLIAQRYDRHENVDVMLNGLSSEFFRSAARPSEFQLTQLVFTGRLGPHKNVDRLINALGVAETKVILHIIGEGESREALEAVARAGHELAVIFHGGMTREDLMRFYTKCDAFVLPSLYETQGLALLEAMACRLPAIATTGVDLADLVECAVVVDPSVEGLAAGIDRLASMPSSERAEMVERAFQRAESHEWNRVLDSYRQLYRSL